jgi:hypothetical protein
MGDFMAALLKHVTSISEFQGGLTANISIWKERNEHESELVLKTLKLMEMRPRRKAHAMVARTFLLAERVAGGEVEAMNRNYPGFPVLEHEIGTIRKRKWYVYIAYVNSKTCLLLLTEGQQRDLAKHRALIWIEKCPDREAQGQPVFVDLLGRELSASAPLTEGQKDS